MIRQETTILKHLIHNDEYTRKVLPYIKEEYFSNASEKIIFKVIDDYVKKYNNPPSIEAICVSLNEVKINESQKEDVDVIIEEIKDYKTEDINWLIDTTENFCRDRALFNGIMESVSILEDKEKDKSRDSIPQILQDALAICFDPSIGHDYIEDFEKRFDYYHNDVARISFDIDMLNKITKNGLPTKSLSILLAGCIHPDTLVEIKVDDVESIVPIKQIKILLKQEKLVFVNSPDGWVKVNKFVNKGNFQEYCLYLDDGRQVRCNANHLFETTFGWQLAEDIFTLDQEQHFLTDNGYVLGFVSKVKDTIIPIVDIEVDHENHRYYTNGISSHNTGVGKSIFMCHMAAASLSNCKNVLYITCEMAEEKIAERIDANLLNVDINEIDKLTKDAYTNKIVNLQRKTSGKLIIKEYAPGTAHAGHFKHLLNELKLKRKFVPDIVFVDYINICASQKYKSNNGVGSYQYLKAVSEELRGIGVEFDIPVVSATQTNREGFDSSDLGMTDVSESFGMSHTADLILALMTSKEMEKLNQIKVKQIKNRYNDVNYHNVFVIGIDRPKMRLFDCESHASKELVENRDEKVVESVFLDLTAKKKPSNYSNLKL